MMRFWRHSVFLNYGVQQGVQGSDQTFVCALRMNWKDIAPKPVDYRIWGLMQERVCKIADSCLQHQQL